MQYEHTKNILVPSVFVDPKGIGSHLTLRISSFLHKEIYTFQRALENNYIWNFESVQVDHFGNLYISRAWNPRQVVSRVYSVIFLPDVHGHTFTGRDFVPCSVSLTLDEWVCGRHQASSAYIHHTVSVMKGVPEEKYPWTLWWRTTVHLWENAAMIL